MKLQIKRLHSEAILPERAHATDSGLDLFSCLETEEIVLAPLERKLIPTGIAIKLPEPEIINYWNLVLEGTKLVYEAQIRAKSGRALKEGLAVLNSPGTIDSEYTGQIQVILINLSNQPIIIKNKQKIAQLIVCPVVIPELSETKDLTSADRGANGFGSTGI